MKIITQKEIEATLAKFFKERPPQRTITGTTGKGGAIMFKEQFLGRPLTPTEKDQMPIGSYQFGSEGLKFTGGQYDSEMPDGDFAFKSTKGIYSIERWKNHWRTHYKEITQGEFEEITKDKKPIDL